MASLAQPLSSVPVLTASRLQFKKPKSSKFQDLQYQSYFPCISRKCCTVIHANISPWEPAPTTYAPENEVKLLNFETVDSSGDPAEASITDNESHVDTNNQPHMQYQYLRWPLWFLGPTVLLVTGVVPTLWLPVSSIFLGPNIASLLSLTGLDCIFNLGASLFLLMADTISRSKDNSQGCISKPPLSYQFWNMVANVIGYGIPLALVFS
ncbi:hypothetical protein F511_10986 [Dorcoceras hygrometricum]|uniref:Uncharacterized protein n=1 Tax=Dorcoceras hygrometricum TaxID=472368 RepID=A0A2Z7CRN9_9LAMI|nr:hypothetical protein F511_10986 [Dorcoceras hygrometricum]